MTIFIHFMDSSHSFLIKKGIFTSRTAATSVSGLGVWTDFVLFPSIHSSNHVDIHSQHSTLFKLPHGIRIVIIVIAIILCLMCNYYDNDVFQSCIFEKKNFNSYFHSKIKESLNSSYCTYFFFLILQK